MFKRHLGTDQQNPRITTENKKLEMGNDIWEMYRIFLARVPNVDVWRQTIYYLPIHAD